MKRILRQGDAVYLDALDRLGRDYDGIIREWKEITRDFGADIVVLENETLFDSRKFREMGDIGKLMEDQFLALLAYVADPTDGGSFGSGNDGSSAFGTHAWVTIKNVSPNGASIQVGNLSGIAYLKTVSLGTWGNKTEHTDLWYDLEPYFVSNYGAYSGRVSLSYDLTASQLNTINNYAINHDNWSYTTNCSSFACGLWNSVSPIQLSAGIINTPKNLADSIKSESGYVTMGAVPYDYAVYYAQGTGAPVRSSIYQ